MTYRENTDEEQKSIAILQILNGASAPIGATRIAHQLKDRGISLGERQVRHHLQIMDERGLTLRDIKCNGRSLTASGRDAIAFLSFVPKI